MQNVEIQNRLNDFGFPCGKADGVIGPASKAAVQRFQRAFNGTWLEVDGVPGPKTQEALTALPHLSPNFVVDELRSHGDGNCYVRRELLKALEDFRRRLNMPLHVIDAYRDPVHNKAVGGEPDSMHLYGLAADVPTICGWRLVMGLELFSGIGDRLGMISHVDMRHLAGSANHTPSATVKSPARWTY